LQLHRHIIIIIISSSPCWRSTRQKGALWRVVFTAVFSRRLVRTPSPWGPCGDAGTAALPAALLLPRRDGSSLLWTARPLCASTTAACVSSLRPERCCCRLANPHVGPVVVVVVVVFVLC
jgi:hypothetical protein